MINPLVPPTTAARKRLLQIPTKMKRLLTAVAVLSVLTSTLIASPTGESIPLAQNAVGASTCRPQLAHYTIRFDSSFGGHWNLTGRCKANRDGTCTESFTGTVSDTSIQASLNRNDLDWVSDSYWLCRHTYVQCSSFSITISDGNVNGFATYKP
jgi:hypothetical protein